jgi:hypothetical protein
MWNYERFKREFAHALRGRLGINIDMLDIDYSTYYDVYTEFYCFDGNDLTTLVDDFVNETLPNLIGF